MTATNVGDAPSALGFLSPTAIGRLAGVLFVIGGAVMVPIVLLAPGATERRASLITVVGVCALTGVAGWVLPWAHWPRWTTLVLPVLACGVVTVANAVSPDPWLYSIYLLLVFAWVGVAHPPGTSLRLFFLVMVVFLAPQLLDGGTDRTTALRAAAVVTPVCLLVGEGLAVVAGRLRQAERLNERRMRELQSLVDSTMRLSRSVDPRQTADLVAELSVGLLGASSALVLLAPPQGGLQPAGAHRWGLGAETALEVEEGATRAMQSGEVTMKADGSLAFLPLISAAGPQGLIVITSPPDAAASFDTFTSGVARTFATQATITLERVRATQSLLDASFRDPLTGIGNRRRADAALELVTSGDALAMVDLDHFKDVNDRFGHAVGDEVLVALARLLQERVRDPGDLVARMGGEEFLLVLRGVEERGAEAVQRLLDEWREKAGGTTFSAGVAVNRAGETGTETLARADQALYRAKAEGRDRVLLAFDPTDRSPAAQSFSSESSSGESSVESSSG